MLNANRADPRRLRLLLLVRRLPLPFTSLAGRLGRLAGTLRLAGLLLLGPS
ncbi:hypothetical protein NKH77_24285 [Streptomyces sp. M19]